MKAEIRSLLLRARSLRSALDPSFSAETARPGSPMEMPCSGHCAAVAAIVRRRLGGWLVSAIVESESHWFNRLKAGKQLVDLDLTADQFGGSPIQIAKSGRLYPGTRLRRVRELQAETLARSELLEQSAGLVPINAPRLSGPAKKATRRR
jgi:hypothetical protein